MAKSRKALTREELVAIYDGLARANLGDYKISVLHLRPHHRSVGAAAADDGNKCHSEQLPNGHFIIVCE
jgi:hypothetical protein